MIYIVNKQNQPLMPTCRHSHVRKLLKQGKAVVISTNPFVVRLKYETEDAVQNIYAGIDTGRENIGLAASNEKGECVYSAHLTTNNKTIKTKMDDRRAHRHERQLHKRQRRQRKALRCSTQIVQGNDSLWNNKIVKSLFVKAEEGLVEHKVIKGEEAKYNNRVRPNGWLTPSGRQLIWCHIQGFEEMLKLLPVSHLTIEGVSFDFQKLENTNITDWNHGPLFGFKDASSYIKYKQQGKCAFCDNEIEHIHHKVPRSKGGSNTVGNLIGVCQNCHSLIHKGVLNVEGYKQKHKVSLLNTIMPQLLDEFSKLCDAENIELKICGGYDTYLTRQKYDLAKDHSVDAYAISLFERDTKSIKIADEMQLRRFKKKSNNFIARLGQREYWLDGKLIAVNRHKSMCQADDSLEELKSKYSKFDIGRIVVKPAKRIYTTHKNGINTGFHPGDVIKYEKHNKVKGNIKKQIFVTVSVDWTNNALYYTPTKNRRMKFCRRISSGAIQYI